MGLAEVLVKKYFSPHWLQILAKGIEKNMKDPSKDADLLNDNSPMFFGDYCNWNKIPEFKEFIFGSNISNLASKLLNSEKVNFYHEHVLVKEPGSIPRLIN
jgi:ectoine hydroxylase-related dioxygenase (phytanoyl-CoA dioxygenase family)